MDLTKETRGEIVEFLEKVEQSGKFPQQACTTMFFVISKNVTSERPIALMPTLIRWWEALRAPEVAKWQQKCRVDWDATDGRNGGAQRTEREVLTDMERFSGRAKAEDRRAVTLVLDLAKAIERVSLLVVLAWATHFCFPRKIMRVFCGCFGHDHHGYFARVEVDFLLLRIVLQDALGVVTNIYPSLELRVFYGCGNGKNEKLKEEVEKKGLQLSVSH